MPPEKLLIVEDDKNILKLLQFNLEGEGYRVVKACDGELGLSLLRQEKPDLVVLDVMLPSSTALISAKPRARKPRCRSSF